METLSLIFACTTVLLAIFYIRRIKIQLNNVEKAFKELSVLYFEQKVKADLWKQHTDNLVKFEIKGKDLIGTLEDANKYRLF